LVERWVEGDRNARVRLWKAKWDAHKLRLRLTKWVLWILIGLATGGAWVFYFTDAPSLAVDLVQGTAHPIAYTTIGILTATTVLFGGLAREQVCIYMCPWPRIQAAMMDEDTLTVAYRSWRGEPRGKGKTRDDLGDCIDCNACVNVCPMGIDIRDGQQLACITCALCIDACDDIMDKVGKPRGLIDYMALTDEKLERAGGKGKEIWQHILRPRTVLYTALWSLVGLGLVFALFIRADIDMTVAPVRNPVYVVLSDGAIRNTYEVRLRNKNGDDRPFHVSITSDEILRVQLEGTDELVVMVPADETFMQRVYVIAPAGQPAAALPRVPVRIWVEDMTNGERAYTDTVFNGRPQ
jgi:cytochrome c oxidase accessory protein FixG